MIILIPNATGPTNIGDQAILFPVVDLLRKNFPNAKIILHTTTPNLYKKGVFEKIESHLYNWAVFEKKDFFERIKRLSELFLAYLSLKLHIPLLAKGRLKTLIKDYLEADLIVFNGGGYFRSQKGISQSLNLLMICFQFEVAKQAKAKKIVMPISFGPFAYKWQEKYAANVLKKLDIVSVRESVSFNLLKSHHFAKIILSTDMALLLKQQVKERNAQRYILGFTIREWLNQQSQNDFLNNFVSSIERLNEEIELSVQPILQVSGDKYGESDEYITRKVIKALKKNNVKVLKLYRILKIKDSAIYSKIDMLLGMRMHSNILAAIQGTPFVAISYEHKTDGVVKNLKLQDYVIKYEHVSSQSLSNLLRRAYKNRVYLKKTINKSLIRIRKSEIARWNKIFQNIY